MAQANPEKLIEDGIASFYRGIYIHHAKGSYEKEQLALETLLKMIKEDLTQLEKEKGLLHNVN